MNLRILRSLVSTVRLGLLSVSVLSAASVARADDVTVVNSEFLHEAEVGQLELTPSLQLLLGAQNYHGPAGLKRSYLSLPLGARVEYGVTHMFSIDFNLFYGPQFSSTTCNSGYTCSNNYTQKGLYDPSIDLKFRTAAGPGLIKFGTALSTSFEHYKIESSGDSNNYSGGTAITPFGAYELPVGPGVLGARLRFDVYRGDRKFDDNSANPTISGSLTGGPRWGLSAFYEATIGRFTYGGALEYVDQRESTLKVGDQSRGFADNTSTFAVHLYVPMQLRPNLVLLPVANITSTNYPSGNAISSGGEFGVGFGARFTL